MPRPSRPLWISSARSVHSRFSLRPSNVVEPIASASSATVPGSRRVRVTPENGRRSDRRPSCQCSGDSDPQNRNHTPNASPLRDHASTP
jgi:hypothetical protein